MSAVGAWGLTRKMPAQQHRQRGAGSYGGAVRGMARACNGSERERARGHLPRPCANPPKCVGQHGQGLMSAFLVQCVELGKLLLIHDCMFVVWVCHELEMERLAIKCTPSKTPTLIYMRHIDDPMKYSHGTQTNDVARTLTARDRADGSVKRGLACPTRSMVVACAPQVLQHCQADWQWHIAPVIATAAVTATAATTVSAAAATTVNGERLAPESGRLQQALGVGLG